MNVGVKVRNGEKKNKWVIEIKLTLSNGHSNALPNPKIQQPSVWHKRQWTWVWATSNKEHKNSLCSVIRWMEKKTWAKSNSFSFFFIKTTATREKSCNNSNNQLIITIDLFFRLSINLCAIRWSWKWTRIEFNKNEEIFVTLLLLFGVQCSTIYHSSLHFIF